MFDHLVGHVRREGQQLKLYLEAAERSESKAFAYVVRMLIEDERHHHRLFADLAESLKTEAELSGADSALPRLDFHVDGRGAILDITRRLIASEKDDALELRRLRAELGDVEHSTLWALLVETMQLDTEKHLVMLRFVEAQTKSRRRVGRRDRDEPGRGDAPPTPHR